nr:phosphoribosylanthranilate isomerase [Parvularcula dongshanensis]
MSTAGLVKICGLTDEAGVEAATGAGADLVGLVFVPKSRRYVPPAQAAALAARARGEASVVGLFQDPALSEIEEVLEAVPLDLLQLHGRESEEDVLRIQTGFGLPVIRAFGVASEGDLYESAGSNAALALYDAKPPTGAGAAGGHGATFDWSVLRAAPGSPRWLLAGGLTPQNAADAVLACRGLPGFAGLDVSSGVESAPGVKDPSRIARFVAATRAAMAAAPQES